MAKKIVALLTCLTIIFTIAIFTPESNAGLQTLNLSKQTKEIKVGESFQLTMTGVKASSIKWKSSKPGVATVNTKGVVKGIKPGSTNITGKYKSLKFNVKINVGTNSSSQDTNKPTQTGDELNIFLGNCANVDVYYVKSLEDCIYIKFVNHNKKEKYTYIEYINLDSKTYNVGNWSSVLGNNFRIENIYCSKDKPITPKESITIKITVKSTEYETLEESSFTVKIK